MTDGERVVLHGHSRGGGVVLETGNQQPERAATFEAILEAAVVPQGRLSGNLDNYLEPIGYYIFPIVIALTRILPKAILLKSPMMWVSTKAKEKSVAALPFTPRQYATAIINMKSIIEWQATASTDSYKKFGKTTLYVGQRDSVLWRTAMIKSAQQVEAVNIIETDGTDHHISLEKPELIRAYFS
jgi:pimeloyl-ACP methyl ester carboxylesterase